MFFNDWDKKLSQALDIAKQVSSPSELSVGGLLDNAQQNVNTLTKGGLVNNLTKGKGGLISKNIGEGGPTNIVNKKTMPWLYKEYKDTPNTKDIPGEVKQLKIPGINWDEVRNLGNETMKIAHGDHTPDFIWDRIPRYVSPGKHNPLDHRIPVDDYNNPIPSLKPRDEDIPLSQLRNLLIRTVA